jgi:methionyl-tRNA synthetase
MRAQLGLPPLRVELGRDLWPHPATGHRADDTLGTAAPLFPTFDRDREAALLEKLLPKPEVVDAPPPSPAATSDAPTSITYEQFAAVDLRVGVVKTCEKVAKKDKLLRLTIDLGEPEPRLIVAGLAQTFAPEALVGKRVVVVANLAPRDFGKGLVSHGMILATGASEALELATVSEQVPAGARLK